MWKKFTTIPKILTCNLCKKCSTACSSIKHFGRRDRKVQERYQEPFIFWLYHYSRLLSVRPVAAVMLWLFCGKPRRMKELYSGIVVLRECGSSWEDVLVNAVIIPRNLGAIPSQGQSPEVRYCSPILRVWPNSVQLLIQSGYWMRVDSISRVE